jgi:type II secretory pathway component GspD/PulD (secretin)
MRRLRLTGWGWALLLLAAGGVWAEPADPRNKLDERIDMTLKKAAPDDLFGSFAKMFGAEAVVDPALSETVSIELHNVRMRTLLNAICESIGCRWSLEAGTPPTLRVTALSGGSSSGRTGSGPRTALPREPIDIKVTDAEVQDVLKTFVEIGGVKAIVDPAIQGAVTLNLENILYERALDAVCAQAACDWSFDPEKSILRVTSRKKK